MDKVTNEESEKVKEYLVDLFSGEDVRIIGASEQLSIHSVGNRRTNWVECRYDGLRKLSVTVLFYDPKIDRVDELEGDEFEPVPEYMQRNRITKNDIDSSEPLSKINAD